MWPKHRLAIAEGSDQRDVLRCVAQVVLATDDVGDRHRLVVDHHDEVVERHPVAAHDHEVAQQGVVELDLAADQVVEADRSGGTFKRSAGRRPSAAKAARSASVRCRQRPL